MLILPMQVYQTAPHVHTVLWAMTQNSWFSVFSVILTCSAPPLPPSSFPQCVTLRFSLQVRQDDKKAKQVVQRALSSGQSSEWQGEVLAHYARVMWEVRHDAAKAMSLYESAVEASPSNW